MSLFTVIFVSFILLFSLSNGFSNRTRLPRQTKVIGTCYNFLGIVKCADGSAILPTANIKLWESDFPWDDLLHTESLEHSTSDSRLAKFAWKGCYNDGSFLGVPFINIEIYYQFKDVCHPGDSYIAKEVEIKRHQKMNLYILHDQKADLQHLD
uniref:Uncharacterized protein n=1 Tax=Panagrolaimus superbus TaxID=310955 RepID=A0A914YKV6_9BILA